MKFEGMTDEQVIEAYRSGNDDAVDYICQKYKPLVLKKAKSMFLVGGETDDLIQEGMLGLFKAIRDYDESRQVTFFYFAQLCITRQIQKAVETSNRKKNQPLNTYISISDRENEEGTLTEDQLPTEHISNPEEMLIDSENENLMRQRVDDSLSPLEKQVLDLHLQGYDYHAIARKLKRTDKGIDNALQRIRSKVRKLI